MSDQWFTSTCPLDCPSACALLVQVTDGRVTAIQGNPDHPFTRGVICGKVSRYNEIQYGERITTPLLRTGPKGSASFRPIEWDAALAIAGERLQAAIAQHGAETVWPFYYGGTMGVVQRSAVDRLTHRAGFSRIDRNICYSIGFAGWQAGVGKALGPNPLEVPKSDLVVLWGINAADTHQQFMSLATEARTRGARLVVIDPYRNHTARRADLHIAPRPGTDGALACAVMQVLLEEGLFDQEYLRDYSDFDSTVRNHLLECTPEWAAPITGVEPGVIQEFARAYGRARAPFIRIGLGMSRQANGAVNIHAVSCLPTLTGAWLRPGGGALFATGDAFPLRDQAVKRPDLMTTPTRILDMSRCGHLLTDATLNPPITALLVFNANPAVSCPDSGAVRRGLQREDLFTLVHEQVMSDTARFADLILPATTFLEHADLYKSYGQYTLQHALPLVTPPGTARSNHEVVNALARQLGFDAPPFAGTATELIAQVLQDSGIPAPTAWGDKPWLDFTPEERSARFMDGFPQPDGKFHFRPNWNNPDLPRLPDHWPVNRRDCPATASDYPLDFMAPPAKAVLNSTFSTTPQTRDRRGAPMLWLNPEDAAARGIMQGDRVVVFNQLGQLTMTAHLTNNVRPGLCLCESNHSASDFPEGVPLNLLTHADRVAPSGGPAIHDNRVQVALG